MPSPPALASAEPHTIAAVDKHEAKPKSISSAQMKALRGRGDELMGMGDVASARLFYERAADAGDAHAALLAGHTFNPAILARFGVKGMQGDAAEAEKWYRRAAELGEKSAPAELADLEAPR